MPTYKDLQDKVNLDYLNQMTLIPETKRAITSVIRCYEGRRFWFNETATTVALVSSQGYLTVPSDFLFLDRLEVTTNGTAYPLRHVNYDAIRNMNSSNNYGQPTDYAYRGDRFVLGTAPDSAYAATIYYVHSLPVLSADSDSNAWTNEAFNLIAHAATLELMSSVMKVSDTSKINYHKEAMYMALNDLHMRNENRLAHRLTPTYF